MIFSLLMEYETLIPRKFELSSGKIIRLDAEFIESKIPEETLFLLWIPRDYVDKVYRGLISKGFKDTGIHLKKFKDEHSISKTFDNWELHIRLDKSTGFIHAEIEVSREYFEHLGKWRANVIYEAFEFYRDIYDKLHIYYLPEKDWITKIYNHFRVKISGPKSLTPWKPVVVSGIIFSVALGILYAISKLDKGKI